MTSEISSAIRSSAQRNPQIFVPVGYAGSGKTELREQLQRKTGAQVVYVGNLTITEIKARGFEKPTPELEKQVREELREKGGPDVYARRAIPLIKEHIEKGENVIVDGIYSLVEWQVLAEEFPDIALHL